jgi:4-amino-4-deoxy-L-arabinose transferase-like glycosyltransferase
MSSASRRRDAVSWACFGLTLLALAIAHADFFQPAGSLHIFDEGYINAFAARMLEGRFLPYVDAVSHRGPLLYWVAAIAAWLGGDGWLPIRACALAASLLSATFTFLAARAAGRPFAGALGALGFALVSMFVFGPMDGMSFNGEHLLDVFAMAALYLTVVALARPVPRLGLVVAAGVCVALGGLSKQNGAVMVPTIGAWMLAAALARSELSRAQRWSMLGAFAGGVALPLLTTVGIYAVAGELDALHYWAVVYNRDIYMGAFTTARAWDAIEYFVVERALLLAIALFLCLWGISRAVFARPVFDLARRWDGDGFTATVALGALLSLMASNASLRGFTHYFMQLVPWFALLFGLLVERAGAARRGVHRALLLAPAILFLFVAWRWTRVGHLAEQAGLRKQAATTCAMIDRHVPAGDPIFVWGFQPDLYTWCRRKPASRYVFTTFVSGVVPWFDLDVAGENRLAVPGSRRELLEELDRTHAPIVHVPKSLYNRSMYRYRVLARYLRKHYCRVDGHGSLALLVWRDERGDCPEQPSPRR